MTKHEWLRSETGACMQRQRRIPRAAAVPEELDAELLQL